MKNINIYFIDSYQKNWEQQLEILESELWKKKRPEYFLLFPSDWDDYGYRTSFELSYFLGEYRHLGRLKIINYTAEANARTLLPFSFQSLPNEFCSLGFDLSYYQLIKENLSNNFQDVLGALRDCAFYPGIRDDFEILDIYNNSLIRFSEAEKALYEARPYLLNNTIEKTFSFNYKTVLPNASSEHSLDINFQEVSELPNRILTLIGKNGTGKTQFLANLAIDLSGGEGSDKKIDRKNSFLPKRPSFSKVISVSYSIFDKFQRPRPNQTFSYKYCGLKDEENMLLHEDQINARLNDAAERIKHFKRTLIWSEFMFDLFGKEAADNLTGKILGNSELSNNKLGQENLSSGQSFLIYVITEIIANIKDDSIILFDEPEMHLHPNAIAKFIRSFEYLLERFNSYAIIATHSPIILQEIPSNNVKVFERVGNKPFIYNLQFESFGESIENLTQEIFQTKDVEDNYKSIFKSLSQKYTYKEILGLFENNLGRQAKTYLLNLYEDPSKELNA